MGSVSPTTKLSWFDRGAAAFERTFPGLIAQRFGPDAGPAYVCPICDRAFSRGAVAAGVLTAEHVPPASFGGHELLLTCKQCNNLAGSYLDAHARMKENVDEVMQGVPGESRKVRVGHRGHTMNARLEVSNAGWTLHPVRKTNNPAALAAFQASGFSTVEPVNVEFVGDRFAELGAKMSWFRSGFLAMFAAFGYQFSFDPALRIAKRQLRSPDTRLIYSFTIVVPPRFSWPDWRFLEIPEPRCTAVMFGRYVVLFPHRGDTTFYERLETDIRSRSGQAPVNVTVQPFELIHRDPLFGYDLDELELAGASSARRRLVP